METMILVCMPKLVQAYEAAAAHLLAIGCATTLADDCYAQGMQSQIGRAYWLDSLKMILSMDAEDVEEFFAGAEEVSE